MGDELAQDYQLRPAIQRSEFRFLRLNLTEAFSDNFLQAFYCFERIRPYCFQSGNCALIQVCSHYFDQAKGGKSFVLRQDPYFGTKAICPANKLCSRTSMKPEFIHDDDLS